MIIPASLEPRASLKNNGGSTLESEVWLWRKGQYLSPREEKITNPTCIKLSVVSVHLCVCTLYCLPSFCLSVCLSGYIQAHPINHLKYLKLACCGVNYENHLITQKFMRFIRIDT